MSSSQYAGPLLHEQCSVPSQPPIDVKPQPWQGHRRWRGSNLHITQEAVHTLRDCPCRPSGENALVEARVLARDSCHQVSTLPCQLPQMDCVLCRTHVPGLVRAQSVENAFPPKAMTMIMGTAMATATATVITGIAMAAVSWNTMRAAAVTMVMGMDTSTAMMAPAATPTMGMPG